MWRFPQFWAKQKAIYALWWATWWKMRRAAACGQAQGTRFIQVDARMQGSLMSLCVKNSGAAPLVYRHGVLWSARRDAAGIGTASVAAVCGQRHGFARYEQKDGVFTAFACMDIEQ